MEHLFKALGDENRLRIFNLLRKGELCVCEIEMILGITQSNVSRHLTKLKNEEIIIFEKKAQYIYYRIHPQFMNENELLNCFINEKMDNDPRFLKDLERLAKYKKSGFTCENLDEMGNMRFFK